jgi:hypothetical protein
MPQIDPKSGDAIDPVILAPIHDKALFYPCCGNDLELPVRLFATAISDFYFVDIKKAGRPSLHEIAVLKSKKSNNTDEFEHNASRRVFRVHRLQQRAEDFLDHLPKLGVLFFRGDNPHDGEGSSGALWLGGELFRCILDLLVPGAIVATDGSNSDPIGPVGLSKFYHDNNIGKKAKSIADPFKYGGRSFKCIGYAGEKYGPTLIWHVA